MSIEEIKKTPFVFIVGRGRSGTTLLQNILDSNNEMILPIESILIIHLKKKYFHTSKWSNSLLREFVEDLFSERKFAENWRIKKEDLLNSLTTYPAEQLSFSIICKIIYLHFPSIYPKVNIRLFGDKNPIYSVFIEELIEVFPDSKFLHIIRDYRDNVLSNVNVIQTESIPLAACGWVAYNKAIENAKHKNPDNFYTLKYEELVNSPEIIVKEICNFLSITFNTKMLDFNKEIKSEALKQNADSLKKLTDFHPNLTKPINTQQINKWKTAFTNQQIQLIEYIAGDYAKKMYGYETSQPKAMGFYFKITSLKYRCKDWINYKIIKGYYVTPLAIRNFIKGCTKFLFEHFKIVTYFNKSDFRYVEKAKK